MRYLALLAILGCGCGQESPRTRTPEPRLIDLGAEESTAALSTEIPMPRLLDVTELWPYELDSISREVPERGPVRCPDLELVRYRGDVLRYHKPTRVFVGFADKLRRFEEIVRDTATEFYGRPPRRIRHLGTYYCRRIRAWPTYISEHGLGNAIDVEGFDFGWIPRRKAPDVPARLRRALQIRIERHWTADRGVAATHADFLHTLAERLVAEPGLFRVMLGPAEPGHDDHFHFDAAPWRIVNIFE